MAIDWGVKATDVAIIFASIVAPIFAVLAAERLQRSRATLDRREWVFRSLMTTRTRTARVKPAHVEAINNIQFAFDRASFPLIETARKAYLEQLRDPRQLTTDAEAIRQWHLRVDAHFLKLLSAIARGLKIPFDEAGLEEESYRPEGQIYVERQEDKVRALMIDVFEGKRFVRVQSMEERTRRRLTSRRERTGPPRG